MSRWLIAFALSGAAMITVCVVMVVCLAFMPDTTTLWLDANESVVLKVVAVGLASFLALGFIGIATTIRGER